MIKRRAIKITKEMAKVVVPGTGGKTVGDVTKLENLYDQGEGRGLRWCYYAVDDQTRLEVARSYFSNQSWMEVRKQTLDTTTFKKIWQGEWKP